MTGNEYQKLAARTINQGLILGEQKNHALHGMVGEIGEIHSIYQKMYQGHSFDPDHMMGEVGDLLWFIAEYCTAKGCHWMTSCKRTSISSKPDILKVLKQTRVCIEQKGYLR